MTEQSIREILREIIPNLDDLLASYTTARTLSDSEQASAVIVEALIEAMDWEAEPDDHSSQKEDRRS